MSREQNTPNTDQIEKLLRSIQPLPGKRFYHHMMHAPWKNRPLENEGKLKMNQKSQTFKIAAVVMAISLIIIITPIGRVFANEVVQFFARVQSNVLHLSPDQVSEPVPTITPEPTRALPLLPAEQVAQITSTATPFSEPVQPQEPMQNLSIVEARYYAGFDLFEPTDMPRDYRLTQITYDPIQQAVQLRYASPRAGSGEFFQITQGKNLEPFSVGSTAQVETISIGEYPAEFVRGGWFVANGSDEAVWENDSGTYTLRWQVNEITISIEFFVNDSFYPAYLERDEMLALANSLTHCDKTDSKTYYTCAISQAAAAAGFTPWQFPTAPQGLNFKHIDYQPGRTALWYSGGAGELGVLQSQQNFATPEENSWFSVPASAIQSVMISGQPGEYVRGEFKSRPGESEAVWDPDLDLERMRWKNGAWWFQIVKWGEPVLSLEELTDLAGQITADAALVQAGRQQEPVEEESGFATVYNSVAEVETAAGFDVLEPGLLPEGLPFSHARCESAGGTVMLFYGSFAADKMHANGPLLLIGETPLSKVVGDAPDMYPPEALESIEVNGYPGQLIKGTLFAGMAEPGQPTPAPKWDSESAILTLTWKTADRFFSIQFDPTPGQGARLSRQDLLQIAASLH
jgi:hypothetical protein